MQKKRRSLRVFLFTSISFLLVSMIGVAAAAGTPADPDEWILGNYLLVGALILVVVGFLTGAYALLFSNIGPAIKRFFLYPLFKVIGSDGDKKPLITKK